MSADIARQPEPDEPPGWTIVQYQLVRMTGVVLVEFVAPWGQAIYWVPVLGMEIMGPCAARYRIMPDGPWIVYAYYPEGYPGPTGPWPEEAELAAARAMLTR